MEKVSPLIHISKSIKWKCLRILQWYQLLSLYLILFSKIWLLLCKWIHLVIAYSLTEYILINWGFICYEKKLLNRKYNKLSVGWKRKKYFTYYVADKMNKNYLEKRPICLLYWSILLKRHLPLKLQLKFIWKELLISSEANVAVSFLTSKNVEFMILIYFYWIDFMSFVFYTLPRFFGPQLHVMILKPNSMRAKYHFLSLYLTNLRYTWWPLGNLYVNWSTWVHHSLHEVSIIWISCKIVLDIQTCLFWNAIWLEIGKC